MLFGSSSDCASKFDGKTFITYTSINNIIHTENSVLAGNYINAILKDSTGILWFGTDNGVSKFDGTNWTTYTKTDGLSVNNVRSIATDKYGNMWFGTWLGGVTKFDGTTWKTYTTSDGLAGNSVMCISSDDEGNMWFGTWLDGVSKLSFITTGIEDIKETTKHFTLYPNPVKDRLIVNNLMSLAEVTVFDLTGKTILKTQTESGNIDVSNLSNGIYILQLKVKTELIREKFIKN